MSSPRVRIQAYCHQSFTEHQPEPVLIPWLKSYYDGLLTPFGLQTDLSLLNGGKNNDFFSMGSAVLQALHLESPLDDIGFFLMAHQTLDTYYPFRSTTTRLCREFSIKAPAIGLTEQELTSPYIALTALLAALRQGACVGSGLLLVLDQATLPYRRPGSSDDDIDNAFVMKLNADPDGTGIAIDGKRYWVEKSSRKHSWIVQSIYSYLDTQRLDMKDVHFVFDEGMDPAVAGALPAPACVSDTRLMSPGGLVTAMSLIAQGTSNVLLAHMSNDSHLYLFSFSRETSAASGATCSI